MAGKVPYNGAPLSCAAQTWEVSKDEAPRGVCVAPRIGTPIMTENAAVKKPFYKVLYVQVLFAIAVGIVLAVALDRFNARFPKEG